ncbi:8287_t:CDS:1, partial [Dentiscutata erythropus]
NYGKITRTNNIRSHSEITSTNGMKTTLKTNVKSQASMTKIATTKRATTKLQTLNNSKITSTKIKRAITNHKHQTTAKLQAPTHLKPS